MASLELFNFDRVFFVFALDQFQVFFGGGQAFVADDFTQVSQGNSGLELLDDESVAKIVDFGVFDSSQFVVAVDSGSDVSY